MEGLKNFLKGADDFITANPKLCVFLSGVAFFLFGLIF